MKYKKQFTVKEIEEIGDRKAVEMVNKEGLGNLRITIPIDIEIEVGDTYTVRVRKEGQ
ncbi:hypothetical protein [Methanonatronarchaeum sp. AMET6-2]|uniref:hypothetical protein n=1 Tax=Methanonatronarchaeum sp. AMET6-2 TaxID=2933293 RepID=UPI001FF4907B|nr:hypothetical protein [Methanonatronarchaeum sp. AMET6-2]UOY10207.1 hypothetical protein MU439_00800 [Methanonatronarchaeum sp. AMET6-2]